MHLWTVIWGIWGKRNQEVGQAGWLRFVVNLRWRFSQGVYLCIRNRSGRGAQTGWIWWGRPRDGEERLPEAKDIISAVPSSGWRRITGGVDSFCVFWVYPVELGEHRKVHLTLKSSQDAFQQSISNQQSINKALFLIVLPLGEQGQNSYSCCMKVMPIISFGCPFDVLWWFSHKGEFVPLGTFGDILRHFGYYDCWGCRYSWSPDSRSQGRCKHPIIPRTAPSLRRVTSSKCQECWGWDILI